MSPSDVAENTRMLVQVVESLEREDFRRIAAPIYGRGFIKLYAELLELDPEPLIRDFMELYDGTRAPSVKTKKVETPAEPPAPLTPPVTRTVTGPAPLSPQRQPVQPRPAVRPLATASTAPAEGAGEKSAAQPVQVRPVVVEETSAGPSAAGAALNEPADAAAQPVKRREFVVEPEEPVFESDEPDLFNPASRQRPAETSAGEEQKRASTEETRAERKLPIFKIGGRLEKPDVPVPQDDAAHARRHARVQAFLNGFAKLKDGVESKLPAALPRKQLLALGGAGLAVLVFMGIGVSVLFKLTGSNVKTTPGAIIERVAPPPALYVD